jgi:hypothetical protein
MYGRLVRGCTIEGMGCYVYVGLDRPDLIGKNSEHKNPQCYDIPGIDGVDLEVVYDGETQLDEYGENIALVMINCLATHCPHHE